MDPAQIRQELNRECPLCHRPLKEPATENLDYGYYQVACEVCGKYRMTEDAIFSLPVRTRETKAQLSAVVRRRWEYTLRPETITRANFDDLTSSVPDKNDLPSKVRYLLGYVAHKSRFPGEQISLDIQTLYSVCFAANAEELNFYIQYAKEIGFLNVKFLNVNDGNRYSLTPKGWEETKLIRTLESAYGFVAMSFSKEGERGALLTQAFEHAIKPAIQDDAGYTAIRLDKEEFLGDVVYEIIARIKESRFVVADVTAHKNGVYFEAGYAMGMALPVIWTCHTKDMKEAHFDTNHLNHIEWTDPADLRERLAIRILATIGRGPKNKQP